MRKLSALLLLALLAFSAFAQTEIILDNGTAAFSSTGTWPTSTAVTGYIGPNYQTHEANGVPPTAIAVDNADAGFSVTGTWPTSTAISGYLGSNYQVHESNGPAPTAVVADNPSGSATGTWPNSTSVAGYYGSNYQVHAAGTGANVFTWTLSVANAGSYQVYARWTQHPNRATNAKYTVNHSAGPATVAVNQEAGGGTWQLLGTFSFDAGSATVSLSDDANDYVIADAVMLVPPGAAPNTATWAINVPSAGTWNVYARWTAHPNRATDAKYTVNHAAGSDTVTVNQETASGTWNLLGSYTFNAGSATVSLTDQANGYVIADAVMLAPPGAQPNTATWTPNVAQPGTYEVYARWTQNPNRATNATYTVTHGQGTTNVPVDQRINGGAWNLLGTFQLSPGTAHKVSLTDQANGYVIADAIRLVPISLQTTLTLYYVHADHLNTPRLVADSTGMAVWKWDQQEPFGADTPNGDPGNTGTTFDLPLRLPGQVYDKESGLHYNYFRDYDPSLGRYGESDPVGLKAGLNTYLYAQALPVQVADLLGLDPCVLRARRGQVFEIELYQPGQLTWRVPMFNSAAFVDCMAGVDLGKKSPIPTGPIAIVVCMVPAISISNAPAMIALSFTDVYLQSQRNYTVEKWCTEGCPPKEVNKGIVGGGVEKLSQPRYVRRDYDWPPQIVPNPSVGRNASNLPF